MTDHRPSRTAREEAIAHIQAVRDFWAPQIPTPGFELDDIPTDTLRRLADERCMAANPEIVDALRQRVEATAADIVRERARADLPDPTITSFRKLDNGEQS